MWENSSHSECSVQRWPLSYKFTMLSYKIPSSRQNERNVFKMENDGAADPSFHFSFIIFNKSRFLLNHIILQPTTYSFIHSLLYWNLEISRKVPCQYFKRPISNKSNKFLYNIALHVIVTCYIYNIHCPTMWTEPFLQLQVIKLNLTYYLLYISFDINRTYSSARHPLYRSHCSHKVKYNNIDHCKLDLSVFVTGLFKLVVFFPM